MASAQGAVDAANLRWSVGVAQQPEFHGVLNKDGAGMKGGQILYPGGAGLAGLFVAVLTHAAINSSVQTAEMKRLQDKADAVLVPYAQALQSLSTDDLMMRTQEEVSQRGWLPANASLELRPVFLMTQDRRAVLMDVAAQFNDGSGAPTSTLGMRVVSDPRAVTQEADDWAEADGYGLRRVCVALLTRAVQHLIGHLGNANRAGDANAPAAAERTVRFVEGGAQRMERATVLEQRCGRALLRTLSNTLMSVPLAATTSADAGCETTPAAAPAPAATASAPAPGA
ncbi:hypothetical protein ACS5PN_15405 [Roseateles sp. NT4]|uniref:hypothetical protein n=1 Tax=Roseateles sp. NT4 TaxID=3453715 RepID=UPI003EED486C